MKPASAVICFALLLSVCLCGCAQASSAGKTTVPDAKPSSSGVSAEEASGVPVSASAPVSDISTTSPSLEEASYTSEESQAKKDPSVSDESESLPTTTFKLKEEYPSMLGPISFADFSRNNYTLGNATFFLEEAVFARLPRNDEGFDFLVFDSIEGSVVGPCRFSFLSAPVETLNFSVFDKDGKLVEVSTLNLAVADFMKGVDGELFTYFSERIEDRYISGAMFVLEESVGFILFFTDGASIYSAQFISFNSNYADAQKAAITDLLGSFAFGE